VNRWRITSQTDLRRIAAESRDQANHRPRRGNCRRCQRARSPVLDAEGAYRDASRACRRQLQRWPRVSGRSMTVVTAGCVLSTIVLGS
jgi:hypothetical protein